VAVVGQLDGAPSWWRALIDHAQQTFSVGQLRDLIEKFKRQWYADVEKAPL
jgi:hypothetical protein